MKAYIKYGLGFVLAAIILAFPGLLITALLSAVSSKTFRQLLDITGSIYLIASLLLLILGKNVRQQIRQTYLEKAVSATGIKRILIHLMMSYGGMVLTAAAGILLMLIPVILH